MGKRVFVMLLLVSVLSVSFMVQAEKGVEEQVSVYSGFDRFVDDVKMFFSGGDGKVRLALEIREKEVDSAIINTENGDADEAGDNLERARKRLQYVQRKVSSDTSEEVRDSVDEVMGKIDRKGLSEDFGLHMMEEEKTGLTAELVVEIDGDGVQIRTREIETRMNEIDGKINDWVVEHGYAEGTEPRGDGGVVVDDGTDVIVDNVVDGGMDVDVDKIDPNAGPKTPVPTDGSICCKKTKYGETRHHWDSEKDCLDPGNIKGDVVDNDVCVALGSKILDEEDPESWGSVDGGVPEPCVEQGAYDDEACERIMEKLPVCCMHNTNGEITYSWDSKDSCVIGYGERMEDESLCLA